MAPTATAVKEEVTHKTTAGSLAGAGAAATVTGATIGAVGTKIANNGINFGEWFNRAKEAGTNAAEAVKENVQNIDVGETVNNIKQTAGDIASNAGEIIQNTGETIKNVVANNPNPISETTNSIILDSSGKPFVNQLINTSGEKLSSAKQLTEKGQGTILHEATENTKNLADNFKNKAGEVLTGLQNNAKELKDGFQSLPPGKQAMVVIPAAIAFALAFQIANAKLSEVQPTSKVENVSKEGVIKGQTTELEIPQSTSR